MNEINKYYPESQHYSHGIGHGVRDVNGPGGRGNGRGNGTGGSEGTDGDVSSGATTGDSTGRSEGGAHKLLGPSLGKRGKHS